MVIGVAVLQNVGCLETERLGAFKNLKSSRHTGSMLVPSCWFIQGQPRGGINTNTGPQASPTAKELQEIS